MKLQRALAFVREHGVVLESAHGRVSTFVDAAAGERIRGSWWSHPKGHEIFRLTRAVRESPDVLVCRLVEGKITYVHRRLWPALVRAASRLPKKRLAAIREVHTPSGKHTVTLRPFPQWVPRSIADASRRLSMKSVNEALGLLLGSGGREHHTALPDRPLRVASRGRWKRTRQTAHG